MSPVVPAVVTAPGRGVHDHLLAQFSSGPVRRTPRPSSTAPSLSGIDLSREAVVEGRVERDGTPVARAVVRLLDGDDRFVAEVPADPDGTFRFFAAPGRWTVRAVADASTARAAVRARLGEVASVVLAV